MALSTQTVFLQSLHKIHDRRWGSEQRMPPQGTPGTAHCCSLAAYTGYGFHRDCDTSVFSVLILFRKVGQNWSTSWWRCSEYASSTKSPEKSERFYLQLPKVRRQDLLSKYFQISYVHELFIRIKSIVSLIIISSIEWVVTFTTIKSFCFSFINCFLKKFVTHNHPQEICNCHIQLHYFL